MNLHLTIIEYYVDQHKGTKREYDTYHNNDKFHLHIYQSLNTGFGTIAPSEVSQV